MAVRWKTIPWRLGTVRQWHWISSAVCLVGMLLFAITGITLNHAASIPAKPETISIDDEVPESVLAEVSIPETKGAPLPPVLLDWLATELDLNISAVVVGEWSEEEVYVALPRPGGDAWLSLDLTTGELIYEQTNRGWISYLNDLHKGRDTGNAWRWFIDIFAVACIVFCITGLMLLIRHAGHRPFTWPAVGLGVVVPVILIILFIQ